MLSKHMQLGRVRAALAPHGLEVMLADAEQAVRLEPPGSPWHTMSALLYGSASMLLGHRESALRGLERPARPGRAETTPGRPVPPSFFPWRRYIPGMPGRARAAWGIFMELRAITSVVVMEVRSGEGD